jgi:fructokinase
MTASAKPLVLGLGELLWDLLPDGKQLGGAPANFAYHAHALGADARVVSAVGADDFGGEALQRLDAAGVDRSSVFIDEAHDTGTVAVALDRRGQPHYTIVENVAWDFIPTSASVLALAARADAICFGTLAQRAPVSRETIRRLLAHAPAECLRILDVNLRAPFIEPTIIRQSCALVNALKLNDEEWPVLAQTLGCAMNEAAFFAELFRRYPLELIALTRGADGATLVTRNERLDFAAEPPAALVDTVGAGDAFTATLTVGWLRKQPLRTIGHAAIRVASYVCSQKGAMPDMRALSALAPARPESLAAESRSGASGGA